ncbi:MAG: aromatic-ring-hydroxylating dioxygenase subunit beta [Pseudomonadota bacterium]
MTDRIRSIEAFLFDEAQMLDERRFEDWLALFDDEAYYWMPCRPDADRERRDSSIIDDDMAALAMRIRRLRLPSAHTEFPQPTAARILSNISILDEAPLTVRAKLVMHEFQRRAYARDDYRVFCATLTYELHETTDSFRILSKKVDLVDSAGSRTMMATPV